MNYMYKYSLLILCLLCILSCDIFQHTDTKGINRGFGGCKDWKTIEGYVMSRESSQPLSGVRITVNGDTASRVYSDSTGFFCVSPRNAAMGGYKDAELTFQKEGYNDAVKTLVLKSNTVYRIRLRHTTAN